MDKFIPSISGCYYYNE